MVALGVFGSITGALFAGLIVGLADKAQARGSSLTIADKKRLELARALATRRRLLMVDEVMAGLTPAESRAAVELVRKIQAQGVTILMVEHVMEVIMPISSHVIVLNYGRKIAEGTPEWIAQHEDEISAYLRKVSEETGVSYMVTRFQVVVRSPCNLATLKHVVR